MAPVPPSANLTLTYPIYSSDFDPNNDGFLFVGGGGGAGRSGVKNKIVGTSFLLSCASQMLTAHRRP